MQFIVKGASRDTGASVTLTIEPETVAQAEQQASAIGVLISEVSTVAAPAPAAAIPGKHADLPGIRTIQKTSKLLKAQYALATLGILAGFAVMVFQMVTERNFVAACVVTLAFAVWLVVVKAAVWWMHE